MAKPLLQKLLDWHHWTFVVFHLPVFPVWIYHYLKSGSLWFMSPSNPTLSLGGFEGEAKSEMYAHLPPHLYPETVEVNPQMPFAAAMDLLTTSGIQFPCIVKPDVGAKGIMFRKIEDEKQLLAYHQQMPCKYLIQEYLPQPFEVSVFYIRHPQDKSGRISAIIKKVLPIIIGDGLSTIEQLMERHPGACDQLAKLKRQHQSELQKILPRGETLMLSEIANLYNGARFTNVTQLQNVRMLNVFDAISHQSRFYYGRYDIRCNSIQDLETGNFKILEFNGAGSVANHIFTGTFSLMAAYREIIRHWKALYEISMHNHRNGIPYWPFWKGLRFFMDVKKHFNRLKKIDKHLKLPLIERRLQASDVENVYGWIE
jgi:hypothetical protein